MDDEQQIRVGFSGHIKLIEETVTVLKKSLQEVFGKYEARDVTLVHSLGEGADRLAYREAEKRRWKREVVFGGELEFHLDACTDLASRSECVKMVEGADKVVRLADGEGAGDGLYAAGDRYIAESCDVLIAMWDGRRTDHVAGTWRVVSWHQPIGKTYHIFTPRNGMDISGAGVVRKISGGQN